MAEDKIAPKNDKESVSAPKGKQNPQIDPDEQKRISAFFDDFVALSKKHGYDIGARLDLSDPTAIKAVPMIVKLKQEEAKDEKADVESK